MTLESQLETILPRRYGVGSNVLYLAWPDGANRALLEGFLARFSRAGLALTGDWAGARLGVQKGQVLMTRILGVFDPQGRFRLESDEGGVHAA